MFHGLSAYIPGFVKKPFKAAFAASPIAKHCPCCDGSFLHFMDFDYTLSRFDHSRYPGFFEESICPCCGAMPRHRILCEWIEHNKDVFKGKKVLYFAMEHSVSLCLKRNAIEYTTADYLLKADLQLDIQDTGLEDGAYGVIIANHVLEHVVDYKKALRELYRILSSDGTLILSVPTDSSKAETIEGDMSLPVSEKIRLFGQDDHLRIFGTSFSDDIKAAGFKVSLIDGNKMRKSINPAVGPANYDVNYLFCCTK